MADHQQFIFENYAFDAESKTLTLKYASDDIHFTETYKFDFEFVNYASDALDIALQTLFFVAGVSYYKAYLPPNILVKAGRMDEDTAKFLETTYRKGLGEFYLVNQLDPNSTAGFGANSATQSVARPDQQDGLLVGLGGGKDSLVTAEALRSQPKVATWSLNHRGQLEPLIKRVGMRHFWVERQWDKQLLELNKTGGAYNGHVPISAIFACVGVVVAILSGYRDVITSNESTASEPSLTYRGIAINHQYSKSIEFESDFQALLEHQLGDSVRYYSFLRPYTEVRISELFAKSSFDKYASVFSSCNRAFVHTSHSMSWCGQCPKCAFVFLALTPFVERAKLEELWGGKNLLLDPYLEPTYKALLGIEGDRPLDCVGEIKESRAAMRLAQNIYPELKKYEFEIPDDYDFRAKGSHRMPSEIANLSLQL